jgi:fructosamine-3-kinase
MDLPERVTSLLRTTVRDVEALGSAVTGNRWRVRLDDGTTVFVKSRQDAPAGFFATEAAGLRWLAAAPGGPAVPDVLGHDEALLVLPWLEQGPPGPGAAERLGRGLAALHAAGSDRFGAAHNGWVGAADLDNTPAPTWPEFYARRRVLPYVRLLRDRGELDTAEAAVFERLGARLPGLAGPPEPPARLHGDLWNGNVLWSADGEAWLVAPAAHGGHRETDLAMLDLFGAAGLETVLASYGEVAPLAPGWRTRTRLHQVHPLLVHAVLFGGAYLQGALAAARRYV